MGGWTCTCIPLPVHPYYPDGIRRLIAGDGNGKLRVLNSKTAEIDVETQLQGSIFHIQYYTANKILLTDSFARISVIEFSPKIKIVETVQVIHYGTFGFVQLLKIRKLWRTYYATCIGAAYSIEEIIRDNQQISIINMRKKEREVSFLGDQINGHEEGVFNIRPFKTKYDILVSCGGGNTSHIEGSKDFSLRLWNWRSKKLIRKFPLIHTDGVRTLDTFMFRDVEERILSSGFDGKVIVWDLLGKPISVCETGVKEGFYTCRKISNSFELPIPQYLLGSMNGSVYSFRIPESQEELNEGIHVSVEKKCSPFVDYVYGINFLNNEKKRKLRRQKGKSKEPFMCVSGDSNWKMFEMKNLCPLDTDLRDRVEFINNFEHVQKLQFKIGWSLQFSILMLLVVL